MTRGMEISIPVVSTSKRAGELSPALFDSGSLILFRHKINFGAHPP